MQEKEDDIFRDVLGRKKKTRSDELLDELLKEYGGSSGVTGENGLLAELTSRLVSRALSGELDHHLGYGARETPPPEQDNRRNGTSEKTVSSRHGQFPIEVPRDREGSFEPKLVGKHQRHFDGFDEQILSMYGRGMSVRDIGAFLKEQYRTEVSPDFISRVTDSVVEELQAWQSRPLEQVYLVVYIDALSVKMRTKSGVSNRSVFIAMGVRCDGSKDVLGLWCNDTEGAKFWLSILTELKRRGVEDILVLCSDGLTGIGQAVEATFPDAIFQTCIVHMIRSSTRFVPWKERKAVCKDLKRVYTADDAEHAEAELQRFEEIWGHRFPMVGKSWRSRWDEVTPFLSFPQEIRRMIYTTNAIENLNRQIRKVLKTRGHMPNEQAALKLIYLAVTNALNKWGGPDRRSSGALLQFAIHFEGRIPQ